MSTASLTYPDVIRVQRVPAIGRLLILSSLALMGVAILLTVISAHANLTDQAAFLQNPAVVAVSIPTPPITNIQPIPFETPTPVSGLASELSVLPVPVPAPPSQ